MLTENQQLFMQAIQRDFPNTYELAILDATEKTQNNLNGMGSHEDEKKSWFMNFTDSIKKIGPALIQYKTQKKIMRTQLRRAERGLPPLDTSSLSPTIRIQPELSPEMYKDIKRFVLPAAVGIGALLVGILLSRKKK